MQRFVAFAMLSIAVCAKENTITKGTVYFKDGIFTFRSGLLDKKGVAYGIYNDTLNSTGWGKLHIKAGYSNAFYSDDVIMYSAGYLEGALTSKHIREYSINTNDWVLSGKPKIYTDRLKEFFTKQNKWMRSLVQANKNDPFWKGVGFILSQFDGLVAGYNSNPYNKEKLDVYDFQILNGLGDILDLQYALMPESIPDWRKMTDTEFRQYIAKSGHCSALVKVLPGFEDVFMGHSTWFNYASMLRIYKHYDWKLFQNVASKRTAFSSYPGSLESFDDFYILGSKMVMLQTTNFIFNYELYKQVKPESLLAWQRVRLANLLANNGPEWANVVSQYNSGTYNNQYMLIDQKKVSNTSIDDGALWVVEQIPTFVEAGDQTPILRAGYWASYNVPFYETIFNMSGYPEVVKEKGPSFTHELAQRAEIFRRDQGSVVDLDSFKAMLRFNNYKDDKYSENDACNAICCRGDKMTNPIPHGCTDTKVTNMEMAESLLAHAISGPTQSHGLPAFKWSDHFNASHIGLPDTYDFHFEEMVSYFP